MYFLLVSIIFVLVTTSKPEIIKESNAKYNLNESHGILNKVTHNDHDNYGVCLLCHTKLLINDVGSELEQLEHQEHWWQKFFSYVKQVLVPSILRQCELHSSCPSMRSLYLVIMIQGHHTQLDNFIQDVGQMFNLRVWSNYREWELSRIVRKIVDQDDCKWLSSVYIDADDSFLDGYFHWVSSELPRKLVQTLTMDGLPWRGAVFAPRSIPQLLIGNGRCFHREPKRTFCSGFSQGQGFLLRRDVWEKMGRDTPNQYVHTHFLYEFRDRIMHGLGFDKYHSDSCQGRGNQIADETESRIMFIDTALEMSTGCVYIMTPFSSSFPWDTWQDLPVCGDEQKEKIQGKYPSNIKYILDYADSVDFNITVKEACRNNRYIHQNVDCAKVAASGDGD